jgi:deoxycytidylate deaminase
MEIIAISNQLADFSVDRPCLKQTVKAIIVTQDGQRILGSNAINNDVDICPRVVENMPTGEGYHLCKDVCNQNEHAEVTALQNAKAAGVAVKGATLYITGHTYFCDNCQNEMRKAGIKEAICLDSDVKHSF